MQKLIILSLILASVATLSPLNAQNNVIDEVIAVVGDNAILRSDIEHQYEQALMEGAQYAGDMKCNIFEEQLISKLLLNQAKLDSVEVSENQIVNDLRLSEILAYVLDSS